MKTWEGRGGGEYEGILGLQAGGVLDLPAGGVRDLLSVVLAPPPVVAVGPPRPPPRTPPRPTPPLTTPRPRVGDLPRIVGGATLQLPLVGGGGTPAHFGPSRHGLLGLKIIGKLKNRKIHNSTIQTFFRQIMLQIS